VTAPADYISHLPQPELDALWDEALAWNETGTLPMDAGMRRVAAAVFYDATALQLTAVETAVYREAAVRARKALATTVPITTVEGWLDNLWNRVVPEESEDYGRGIAEAVLELQAELEDRETKP
jgi:hypothetical protein